IPISINDSKAVMGYKKSEAIHRLLTKNPFEIAHPQEEVARGIEDHFIESMIEFYKSDPLVKEADGASKLFDLLRENDIKVALSTGFSRPITDTIITRLGWEKKIDFSVSSDEVPRGRPFPDMIKRLMDEARILDPEEVMKVGDTLSDIREGQIAGCGFTIGISTGSYQRYELKAADPHRVIDHLMDIPPILSI
ncbi:MAG: HAD hydrolase-like protein, partial [Bacteroidota bacterium]